MDHLSLVSVTSKGDSVTSIAFSIAVFALLIISVVETLSCDERSSTRGSASVFTFSVVRELIDVCLTSVTQFTTTVVSEGSSRKVLLSEVSITASVGKVATGKESTGKVTLAQRGSMGKEVEISHGKMAGGLLNSAGGVTGLVEASAGT